jgi:hypothetical protein
MSVEVKKERLERIRAEYEKVHSLAIELREQIRVLRDEIAAENAKFPVGTIIVFNKTKAIKISGFGWSAKHKYEPYQEKYRVTYVGENFIHAVRIKNDGSDGASKRFESWDVNRAELLEPPK